MSTKFLAARVPSELMDAIDEAAKHDGITRTDFIIAALYEAVGKETAEVRLSRLADRMEAILKAPVSHSKPVVSEAKQSIKQVKKTASVVSGEGGYQPTDAELVIIELSNSGMKNVAIADHLNERGFTTITGLEWDNLKVRDAKSRLKKRGLL